MLVARRPEPASAAPRAARSLHAQRALRRLGRVADAQEGRSFVGLPAQRADRRLIGRDPGTSGLSFVVTLAQRASIVRAAMAAGEWGATRG